MRAIEDGGYLLDRHVQQIAVGEDGTVHLAQVAQLAQDDRARLFGDNGGLGRRLIAATNGLACDAGDEAGAPAGCPAAVEGLVGDDAQELGAKWGAEAEPVEGVEGLDEPFLGGVFCFDSVMGNQECGAEGDVLIAGHQTVEGGRVAYSRTLGEAAIVHCLLRSG